MFRFISFVIFVAACGSPKWEHLEDCDTVRGSSQRDECFAQMLPELFRTDAERASALVESEVQDQRIRDFIYLAVTRRVDPSTYQWCDKIEEPALKDRCRVLVSRPHLHRELVGPLPDGQAHPPPGGALPGSPNPAAPQ